MGRALAKDPSDASQDDLSYHADGHATSEILEGSGAFGLAFLYAPFINNDSFVIPPAGEANGEAFDHVPSSKRTIGLWSAIFLIFNRIIGTGCVLCL